KQIGKAQDRNSNRLGHPDIGVRTQQTFHARVDGEAVLFDLLEGMAEFRRKVWPEGDDPKVHRFRPRQISQGPVQMPIVCSGRSDNGDAPLHTELDCCCFAASRTNSLGRYSGTNRQICPRTPARSRLPTLSFKSVICESNSS